jgi:hypothetical protein
LSRTRPPRLERWSPPSHQATAKVASLPTAGSAEGALGPALSPESPPAPGKIQSSELAKTTVDLKSLPAFVWSLIVCSANDLASPDWQCSCGGPCLAASKGRMPSRRPRSPNSEGPVGGRDRGEDATGNLIRVPPRWGGSTSGGGGSPLPQLGTPERDLLSASMRCPPLALNRHVQATHLHARHGLAMLGGGQDCGIERGGGGVHCKLTLSGRSQAAQGLRTAGLSSNLDAH